MELTGTEDLRVQRTVSAIQDNFVEMLYEMDYRRITVKELCARARINKKTFYHYYETLDALLAELQSRYVKAYMPLIADFRFPDDIDQMVRTFFAYSSRQDKTYERITCAASFRTIREAMTSRVTGPVWEQATSASDGARDGFTMEVLYHFWNNTVLEIYRQWVEGGKPVPVEEVCELAVRLVCDGMHGVVGRRPEGL